MEKNKRTFNAFSQELSSSSIIPGDIDVVAKSHEFTCDEL